MERLYGAAEALGVALSQAKDLAGLGDDVIAELAKAARLQAYTRGEPVGWADSSPHAAYVVIRGACGLWADVSVGPRGSMAFALCAGEMLCRVPAGTHVAANIDRTAVCVIPGEHVASCERQYPPLQARIAESQEARLSSLCLLVGHLTGGDIAACLALRLVELARASRHGTVRQSCDDLGRLTGVRRQAVSQELDRFERHTWIKWEHKGRRNQHILLVDEPALRRCAEEGIAVCVQNER